MVDVGFDPVYEISGGYVAWQAAES